MRKVISLVAAMATVLAFSLPVHAQDSAADMAQAFADVAEQLGLNDILRETLQEQDIDALNVFIQDTIAGKNPTLSDDLRKRLEIAAKKLKNRAGPMLELLLNFAAENAKRALRRGQST